MRIILLEKIEKLGDLGDHIDVKGGFARNFLIPQGKAVSATKKNMEYFELHRIELQAKLAALQLRIKDRIEKINNIGQITIKTKAGKEGKLFGSIGARDIISALIERGIEITKKEIRLLNGVLRTIGTHQVRIQLNNKNYTNLCVILEEE